MKRLFLFLCLSSLSWGAELLNVTGRVMVVDFNSKRVELNIPAYKGMAAETRVCLQGKTNVKQTLDLKCGKILNIDKQKVLMEITKGGLTFSLGELVTVITENKSVGADRMIASYYDSMTGQLPARSGVAGGMTFGLNYFFPSVHVEFAVSHAVSLGITGVYGDSQANNTRNKTYGGLLGLTIYTPQPALGLNFELLAGVYKSEASFGVIKEEVESIMGAALIGWKGYFSEQFHYRVNAGAQYVSNQTKASLLDFSSVLPFFRAEIGVSF